jgi:hypothetical protein
MNVHVLDYLDGLAKTKKKIKVLRKVSVHKNNKVAVWDMEDLPAVHRSG